MALTVFLVPIIALAFLIWGAIAAIALFA